MGDQMTAFVAENPMLTLYVARSIIEGGETTLRIFDALVALADARAVRLKDDGMLRKDIDMLGVAAPDDLQALLRAVPTATRAPPADARPSAGDAWAPEPSFGGTAQSRL
jgi:hypothetical protein